MEKLDELFLKTKINYEIILKYQKLIYHYQNNLILCDEKTYQKLTQLIILLGITSVTMIPVYEKINYKMNNTNFELMYEEKTIEEVIENNSNLDENSKKIIYQFVNTIEDNFDLTLFKANVEKLKIIYLTNDQFKDKINIGATSTNSVAFFDIIEGTIYINEDYNETIYHELFHLINNYYDSNFGMSTYCTDKGKALLEGMNARYTDMYFDDKSYKDEKMYIQMLREILSEEKIKYYFESGTVDDTINDLSDLYGDEEMATNLIILMDKKLNISSNDYETYVLIDNQIMDLFQNYFLASEEQKINEILKSYNNQISKNKIAELLLKVYLTNCDKFMNYYNSEQIKKFEERKTDSLVRVYNNMKKYEIYTTKEEFLDDLTYIKESIVAYNYEDIKNCLINHEETITFKNNKTYKR